MMQRLRGLAAAAALLAILLGIPAVLALHGTVPTHLPGWAEIATALRTPDDGTIALTAFTIVGWLAWLILAAAILAELAARARGVSAPRLPRGMRWAQGVARTLVAAAVLTFAAATPSMAHAAPAPAATSISHTTPAAAPLPEAAPTAPGDTPAASAYAGWVDYQVQRGDTMWSIAQQRLGAGEKYREIAAANRGVLGDQPGFLQPGWTLRVPPLPAVEKPAATVTVRPGDTLSGIAHEQLGDAHRYDDLAAATATLTQPDGAHLSDPDLIRPGWRIVIPADPTPTRHTEATDARPVEDKPATNAGSPKPVPAPVMVPPDVAPAPEQSHSRPAPPVAAPQPSAATRPASTNTAPAAASSGAQLPQASWVLAGLTGGGALLAGSLLVALRRRRQAQFRARRPGRAAAATAPELAAVEQTITTYGAPAALALELVDLALRDLARTCHRTGEVLPDLAALELGGQAIVAHLASPGQLPPGWQRLDQTGQRWAWDTATVIDDPADLVDQPAPWPLLVTIGTSRDGHQWLLNTEAYPLLHVHGPGDAEDFVRSLVAELAVSVWARDLRIDCVDLLPELAPLNPARLRHHPTPGQVLQDATAAARQQADLADQTGIAQLPTGRAHQAGDELWTAHLVVARPDHEPGALTGFTDVLRDRDATGAALMLTGDNDTDIPGATVLLVGPDELTLPDFGLTLTPVRLSAAEGAGCAALMAGRLDLDDTPMPALEDSTQPWQDLAAIGGSIREDLVRDRGTAAEDATTLLHAPDEDYLAVAATTKEDLAALAPRVPAEVHAAVTTADPHLDADLAAWTSDTCDLPRLQLLGTVQARAHGDPYAVTERKAYYTEMLAWFALHPGGGTSAQLMDAFGITAGRVRGDVKAVRDWLGINPRTGTKHLPDARQSAAGRAQGRGIYQVDGLLTDLDLFRRLRVRGQARGGPEGMNDLAAALTLVSGRPFTGLREAGWSWLLEGDRIDEHMVCAIVDVAHLVVTDALHRGDTALARAAAEVAAQAAPYEDTPKLDLAAIARADGQMSVARAIIEDDICNRSDDPGLPPTELPARTRAILATGSLAAKAS